MKLKRNFNGPDGKMWTNQSNMRAEFAIYLAAFTAIDPEFDATYLNNWQTALNEAITLVSDELEVAEEETLLDEMKDPMGRCRDKYREVKFFAGKAFPGNGEVMREFGEGKYSKVSKSHLQMVKFMEEMHGVAEKYKTALLAKGYTQPAIDAIETLAEELHDDNLAQQLKKKERPAVTRSRIEKLNALYAFGQTVSRSAALVFPDSPAKQKLFRLMQSRGGSAKKRRWFLLAPKAIRKCGLKKLAKLTGKITLLNQGAGTVEYWMGNNAKEIPENPSTLDAGEMQGIEIKKTAFRFLFLRSAAPKPVRVRMELA